MNNEHVQGQVHVQVHVQGLEHEHAQEHAQEHKHTQEHAQEHKYFADVHADLASQFFGAMPHRVPDTDEITQLRTKLDALPDDYDALMELAGKLDFQLRYRESIPLYDQALVIRPNEFKALYERAARYFKTLQFERALADYVCCNEISPNNGAVLYRLGITYYVMGKTTDADRCFTHCIELFSANPEMLVASAYWLSLASLRGKTNNEIWKSYDFSLDTPHHCGYRDGLRVLCKIDDAEEMFEKWVKNTDTLNASIVLYALSVYHRACGAERRANEVFSITLAIDEYWAGFAYIAAWAERIA